MSGDFARRRPDNTAASKQGIKVKGVSQQFLTNGAHNLVPAAHAALNPDLLQDNPVSGRGCSA